MVIAGFLFFFLFFLFYSKSKILKIFALHDWNFLLFFLFSLERETRNIDLTARITDDR